MSKLHAQLALFGLIDEVVTKTENPDIATTVEAFLPGTTGPGQRGWYSELKSFLSKDDLFPRDDDGNVIPRNGAVQIPNYVEALAELRSGTPPGESLPPDTVRPAADVMSRSLFAGTILAKMALLVEQLPIPGFDKLATDPLNALLPMAVTSSSPGSEPQPQPQPLPPAPPPPPGPPPPSLRDRLLNIPNRRAYTEQLFSDFGDQIDADVALRPIPCTGALRKVDGRYCTVLTTDWFQPFITLAEMRAIIDPLNWPRLCDFFVRMTAQPRLTPDSSRGWSRVVETVSGDKTQWELRTALKYWKGVTTTTDDIYINYDLDNPRIGDDKLVDVDSGYIWITSVVPSDPSKGVRIRTCKAVRIRGLSATATAALGCVMGWGDAASQMLVDKAKRPPADAVSFGKPSVDPGAPGVLGPGVGSSPFGTARPSSAAVLADAEAVELPVGWRGAMIANIQNEVKASIDVAAPLATDLLTRWSDGMSAEDIKQFGERAGRELTDRAVKMFNAAAGAVRPPSSETDATEGNSP